MIGVPPLIEIKDNNELVELASSMKKYSFEEYNSSTESFKDRLNESIFDVKNKKKFIKFEDRKILILLTFENNEDKRFHLSFSQYDDHGRQMSVDKDMADKITNAFFENKKIYRLPAILSLASHVICPVGDSNV